MIEAMGYGLIFFNLLSLVGLVVTAFLGYAFTGTVAAGADELLIGQSFTRHFALALSSTIVAIFGQSMMLFYFIGTGKSIRTAVVLYKLDPGYVDRTRLFKKRAFPPATLTLLAVMAGFVIGGGAASGALPGWLHHGTGWVAICLHGGATLIGTRTIVANMALLNELDRVIARRARDGEVDVKRAFV